MAAIKRFRNCLFPLETILQKLLHNRFRIRKRKMQFQYPQAGHPKSSRRTGTLHHPHTFVIFEVYFFSPRNKTESPVPPPMVTTGRFPKIFSQLLIHLIAIAAMRMEKNLHASAVLSIKRILTN